MPEELSKHTALLGLGVRIRYFELSQVLGRRGRVEPASTDASKFCCLALQSQS